MLCDSFIVLLLPFPENINLAKVLSMSFLAFFSAPSPVIFVVGRSRFPETIKRVFHDCMTLWWEKLFLYFEKNSVYHYLTEIRSSVYHFYRRISAIGNIDVRRFLSWIKCIGNQTTILMQACWRIRKTGMNRGFCNQRFYRWPFQIYVWIPVWRKLNVLWHDFHRLILY